MKSKLEIQFSYRGNFRAYVPPENGWSHDSWQSGISAAKRAVWGKRRSYPKHLFRLIRHSFEEIPVRL